MARIESFLTVLVLQESIPIESRGRLQSTIVTQCSTHTTRGANASQAETNHRLCMRSTRQKRPLLLHVLNDKLVYSGIDAMNAVNTVNQKVYFASCDRLPSARHPRHPRHLRRLPALQFLRTSHFYHRLNNNCVPTNLSPQWVNLIGYSVQSIVPESSAQLSCNRCGLLRVALVSTLVHICTYPAPLQSAEYHLSMVKTVFNCLWYR